MADTKLFQPGGRTGAKWPSGRRVEARRYAREHGEKSVGEGYILARTDATKARASFQASGVKAIRNPSTTKSDRHDGVDLVAKAGLEEGPIGVRTNGNEHGFGCGGDVVGVAGARTDAKWYDGRRVGQMSRGWARTDNGFSLTGGVERGLLRVGV